MSALASQEESLESRDRLPVRFDWKKSKVRVVHRAAGRPYTGEAAFGDHPVAPQALRFLWEVTPNYAASSVYAIAASLAKLVRYLSEVGSYSVTAQSFGGFLAWLKTPAAGEDGDTLDEAARRRASGAVKLFVTWCCGQGDVGESAALAVARRHRKVFRGFNRRQAMRMLDDAVPREEFACLLTAIRLEMEEVTELLDRHAPDAAELQAYDPGLPMVPFVALLGLTLVVRSSEVNVAKVQDWERYPGELYVHAPNKLPARIPVPAGVRRASELAFRWMARWRFNPSPEAPLLVVRREDGAIVRWDTVWINSKLKTFYRKYFNKRAPNGARVLFSLDGEGREVPFWRSYVAFRSMGISEAAYYERNPERLRVFARHRSVQTTLRYYVKLHERDMAADVARSMRPAAEQLRMEMRSRIATTEERKRAKGSKALLRGGHCHEALEHKKRCVRAIDCRLCEYFRIHPERRFVFVHDRDAALAQVERERGDHGLARDAENWRRIAALNQAVIDRIDDEAGDA